MFQLLWCKFPKWTPLMRTMKDLFLNLLFLISFGCFPLAGQEISGVVQDAKTQQSLQNVSILIPESHLGCITDSDGKFGPLMLVSGIYKVKATLIGYQPQIITISVPDSGSVHLDFFLNPLIYLIDTVEILGQKNQRNLILFPQLEPVGLESTKTTITRKEIEKLETRTVIEALKYTPGGLIESRGRKIKNYFSVRGQIYPYPNYLINGIWQKDFNEMPYFISASDVEKIEIIRSSAALLSGLTSLAGTINIQTREYETPHSSIELEYGTFQTLHSHLSHGGKVKNFNYAVGIGYDRTKGPAGRHAKEEMLSFYWMTKWMPVKSLSIKTSLFYLDGSRELTIALPPADNKYLTMLQSFDPVQSVLANMKVFFNPGNFYSSDLQVSYALRNPVFRDEVAVTEFREKDYEWTVNFIHSLSLSARNHLRFGGLFNHWVAPAGKGFFAGRPTETETFSWVLVDEQKWQRFTLDAGIRWIKEYYIEYGAYNIEGDGALFKKVLSIEDQWMPANIQGSLGFAVTINPSTSLYLNSAFGQIKPRVGTLDTNLTEPGNEQRIKLDLGITNHNEKGFQTLMTIFTVIQENAIKYSGETYLNPATNLLMELYTNRDQIQTGVEIELKGPLFSLPLDVVFNATAMQSWIDKVDKMVVNKEYPALILNGGFDFQRSRLQISLMGKYVSYYENNRFASISAGPQPLGDFFNMDAVVKYTLTDYLKFFIKLQNISNIKYSTVVGYPDFGRQIHLGLKLDI